MAACDLIDVIVEDICSAEMGGVGDECFYCERSWMKKEDGTMIRPDDKGNLPVNDVITALDGHLHKFDFRPKTGQGQGTLDDGADSNNMTFAGRVDKGCDDFRQIDHAARFKDLIYIVKKPGGKFFVYYSPDNKATYASTYDSGQEHNSDHGISFTVTVPGSEYQYLLCDFASATGTKKDPSALLANGTISKAWKKTTETSDQTGADTTYSSKTLADFLADYSKLDKSKVYKVGSDYYKWS